MLSSKLKSEQARLVANTASSTISGQVLDKRRFNEVIPELDKPTGSANEKQAITVQLRKLLNCNPPLPFAESRESCNQVRTQIVRIVLVCLCTISWFQGVFINPSLSPDEAKVVYEA